ncbi:MAG: chemotaxis protein CheX [Thermogutta sp.]
MTTMSLPDQVIPLPADPRLAHALVAAVEDALTMCNARARLVGVNCVPIFEAGAITGVIGLHGKATGFLTFNTCEQVAVALTAGFLQEPVSGINGHVVDTVGELTNLIAGGLKKRVSETPWGIQSVTVPSVIVGHNYQIAYARGITYLSATFEHDNPEAFFLHQRLLQAAVSLLRV